MRGDERLELHNHALVTTERELEVDPLLDHREPKLGQPGNGRRRELLVGEVRPGHRPATANPPPPAVHRTTRITVRGRRLSGRNELLVPVARRRLPAANSSA